MNSKNKEETDIEEYIEEEEDRIDTLTSIFKKPKTIDLEGPTVILREKPTSTSDFFNEDGSVKIPTKKLSRKQKTDYLYEQDLLKKNTRDELVSILDIEFGMSVDDYKKLGLKFIKKDIVDFIIERRLGLSDSAPKEVTERYLDVEWKGSGKTKVGRYSSYLILVCGECGVTVICGKIGTQCQQCHKPYDLTPKEKSKIETMEQ